MADSFVFGTQYYRPPNPPAESWARDLSNIGASGFNTVKLWLCWSWMHRAPDQIDFGEIDRLMDLAADRGLRVVLNLILENAPYWLEELHPEARYRAHDGRMVALTAAINTPGGGWPGLCFDNAPARAFAEEFLRGVVGRYRDHSALLVWDVWNEPHLEPSWYYPDRLFCYCAASLAAFRDWLAAKYGDLEGLNRAWARRYSRWSQVQPPRAFETYPDFIDWRTFWLQNLARWLEWKAQAVRWLDPHHPVMTHVASSGYLGTLATNTWDEWLLAEPVDLFGTSSFPKWLMGNDPAVHLFHLDAVRAAARGKRFWQSELQGGHGRDLGFGRSPHPQPADIRMWIWNVLAAGGKGLLFWQWRPELLGPESPGYGLCALDGRPTPRTQEAARLAAFVRDHPELATSEPLPPEVGIVISRDIALLVYAGERSMDLYARALQGAYRAFFDRDVPVDFVHTDTLAEVVASGRFRVLYFPLPLLVDAATAEALTAFVVGGGTLVAEACPGHYREGGWCEERIPGQGLHVLFGAEEVENDRADEVVVHLTTGGGWPPVPVSGELYREVLRPTTARAVGHFDDGAVAATANAHGRGQALLIGTFPSLGYEVRRRRETADWIASFAEARSVRIRQALEAGGPLITRLHRAGAGHLLFILNWGDGPARGEVTLEGLPFASVQATGEVQLLGAGRLRVALPPREGCLVALAGG